MVFYAETTTFQNFELLLWSCKRLGIGTCQINPSKEMKKVALDIPKECQRGDPG